MMALIFPNGSRTVNYLPRELPRAPSPPPSGPPSGRPMGMPMPGFNPPSGWTDTPTPTGPYAPTASGGSREQGNSAARKPVVLDGPDGPDGVFQFGNAPRTGGGFTFQQPGRAQPIPSQSQGSPYGQSNTAPASMMKYASPRTAGPQPKAMPPRDPYGSAPQSQPLGEQQYGGFGGGQFLGGAMPGGFGFNYGNPQSGGSFYREPVMSFGGTQFPPSGFYPQYGSPFGGQFNSPQFGQVDAFIQRLNDTMLPYQTGAQSGRPQFNMQQLWGQAGNMVQNGWQNPFAMQMYR